MTEEKKVETTEEKPNALNITPPEQDPKRFLGVTTKDGEAQTEETKPTKAAAKDVNGKTAALVVKVREDDGDGDDKDTKAARPAQKRIDQAIARQRAAERRADISEANQASLERRLIALEASRTAPVDNTGKGATSDANAPQPGSYEYGELDARYIKDLAVYETRKTFAAENAKTNTAAAIRANDEAAKVRAAKIETWATDGSTKHDDFDEVVIQGAKDGLWPLSETLGQLLLESEVGHDIAYSLASNPKEAQRVAKLSAARQAAWFGQEEARLTAESSGNENETTQSLKVTKAPPPVAHKAKGTGESNPVSPDTNDFAAFERLATQTKQ